MMVDLAIIGAGVAGCSMAYAARQAGLQAVLLDQADQIASGASGNPVGLVKPLLSAGNSPSFQFHRAAFSYFLAQWPQLSLTPLAQGIAQYPKSAAELPRLLQQTQASHLPEGWAIWRGDYAWLPPALAIDPVAYCHALAGDTPFIGNVQITAWQHVAQGWQVGQGIIAKKIVLCAGIVAQRFALPSDVALRPRMGQLTYLPASHLPPLPHPISWGHYLAQKDERIQVLGATFDVCAWDAEATVTTAAHERNLAALRTLPAYAHCQFDTAQLQGRTAIRATTPDHLPRYGAWPDQDGVYYLLGLGSRGLMTAPYTAHLLLQMMQSKTAS